MQREAALGAWRRGARSHVQLRSHISCMLVRAGCTPPQPAKGGSKPALPAYEVGRGGPAWRSSGHVPSHPGGQGGEAMAWVCE